MRKVLKNFSGKYLAKQQKGIAPMSIRVALFGVSGYARTYVVGLTKLQDAGEIDFAGAVIRTPSKAPEVVEDFEKRGIKIYPDTASLYKDCKDLDLVCIPTGIASHEELTIEALEHGCHVLVEKPLTGSMESARRMAAAQKKYGKSVMIGYQHIYLEGIQKIKQHLVSGKLGKVKRVVTMGLWPRGDVYYARNGWAGKMAVAGTPVCDSPINNAFAHYLNISLFFSGRSFEEMMIPVTMQAEMYRSRAAIETFDTCALKVKSAEGSEVLALFCHTCPESVNPVIHVECENGTADWGDSQSWSVKDAAGNVIETADIANIDRGAMFNAAVAKVRGEKVFTSTIAAAAVQTFCIDCMHKFFTINPVDAAFAPRREEDGVFLLKDVETYWPEAMAKFQMPSETGAPWAVASKEIALPAFELAD